MGPNNDWLGNHISQFLDTVGDGSGTTSAIGDYSSVPGVFKISPAAGEVFSIARMLVYIEDAGTISADEYGNLAALTNGVKVSGFRDSVEQVALTGQVNIKTNSQWGRICYDSNPLTYGNGNNIIVARWTFSKSGRPIILQGDELDDLRVTLTDNLTGLIDHTFLVQGFKL